MEGGRAGILERAFRPVRNFLVTLLFSNSGKVLNLEEGKDE
jgi:hypothetical protein